jgi:tetratricopeptide (TPR) repeat protein
MHMERDMKTALVVGIFTLFGAILGASMPYFYSVFSPSEATNLVDKGNDFYFLGEYNKAIECFNKAIDLNPKSEKAWANKGNALIKLGKYNEALQACDKAIKINPKSSIAWFNKGYAFIKLGDPVEANQAYDMAIEINPLVSRQISNVG